MKTARAWILRLAGLFGGAGRDRELAAELESHLAYHVEENVRLGMAPAEARRRALLALGGLDQTKERYRDRQGIPWLEHLVQDLRFGTRSLRSSPGFTAVATLTLTIGLGANTAVFSLASTLLLRPLAIAEPSRAVHVYTGRSSNTPYADYLVYRDGNATLSSLGAFSLLSFSLRGPSAPEHVPGAVVSGNYFSTVGVLPALGRLLDERDDRPGAEGAVVVSYQSWQRRFESDPTVIGRALTINGHPFTLVGVLGPEFVGEMLPFAPELWIAWHASSRATPFSGDKGHPNSPRLTGRLAPGRSLADVQADLSRLAGTISLAHPDTRPNLRVNVVPASVLPPEFSTEVGLFMALLMSLAAMVLIVGCVNLANLLMARWSVRRREIAVRLALGAGRGRVIRQLMTESLLLSACGAACAAALANWLIRLASGASLATPVGPVTLAVAFDWRVMLFTFVAASAATIMLGLVPALQISRGDVQPALKDGGHVSPLRSRTRAALMVVQLALSTVLLAASGLLVRSMAAAVNMDRGFDGDRVLAASIDVSTRGYDETRGLEAYASVLERVRAIPGIRSAHLVDIVPLTLSNSSTRFLREGDPIPAALPNFEPTFVNAVSPDHFATLGIPLLSGRDFNDSDTATSTRVAIVNETMARRFWPGESPIGKRVTTLVTRSSLAPPIQVIGVARDSKYATIGEGSRPFLYRPLSQRYTSVATLLARTDGDPLRTLPAIRAAVAEVDADLPLYNVGRLNDLTGLSLLPLRVTMYLAGALGMTALILAVIGLYGVVSFLARSRRREIGIRVALGASPSDVTRLVSRQGMTWIAVGLGTGLAAALAFTRLLAGLLYGVTPHDPLVFATVAALLGTTAYLSCREPARRASRLDPAAVLRDE
jgi:predicted permease